MNQRVIYCFWTGSNEMSAVRRSCFEHLKEHSGVDVILVTPETLGDYILPEYPLHEAYPYLSNVHRSDYLRVYFMHHFGGGYSDIKRAGGSWVKAFEDMDETTWVNGYQEIHPEHIAHTPHRDMWSRLIGNGAFIFRPHTPISELFYSEVRRILDAKLGDLKKNPATTPCDCSELGNGYPLGWNEILGRIFHRIQPLFFDQMKASVPYPDCSNYR
jgi:hypothetical protein